MSYTSSSPGESRPQALTESYMKLSLHTALPIRPYFGLVLFTLFLPLLVDNIIRPDGASPSLLSHYRTFNATTGHSRPCASHWYSGTCSCNYLCGSLDIETTGSHVPYKTLLSGHAILYAGCRLGRIQATPKLITEKARILLLTP